MKAADIPDERLLLAVLEIQEEEGMWACWWDIQPRFQGFPHKVVCAKAGQLIKRDLLDGDPHPEGRGDLVLTAKGLGFLAGSGVSDDRLARYARDRYVTR